MDPMDPGNNDNNQPPRAPLGERNADPYGPNVNLAEMIQRSIHIPSLARLLHDPPPAVLAPQIAQQLNPEFTQAQIDELERYFDSTSRYPDVHSRAALARTTGLSEHQIQSWFLRRRIIRRQNSRRSARADNIADMGQDFPQFGFAPPPMFLPWLQASLHPYLPLFPPTMAPPPPAPVPQAPAPRPDRDTEDQISYLVDNLDDQIVQLKKELKDEQDARKAVEVELEMARRELEFLKNNSASEVEELISMTSALELNKTGLAEQNAMLQEQVAQLQSMQINLEAELARVNGGAGPSSM